MLVVGLSGAFLHVTLPVTKTKIVRTFTVVGEFYRITKMYMKTRPETTKTSRIFLTYRAGKCVIQPLGINKIGGIPHEFAKFLKLENPELYTYRSHISQIICYNTS